MKYWSVSSSSYSYPSYVNKEEMAEEKWATFVQQKTGKKLQAPVVYITAEGSIRGMTCPKVKEIVEKEKLDKIVVMIPLSLKLLLQKWYQHSHNEVAVVWKPEIKELNGLKYLKYLIVKEWDLPDEQRPSPAFVEIVKDTSMWEGGAHLHPPGITSFSGTDERSILQQYKWNLLFLSPTGKVVKIAYKTELPCGEPIIIVTEPIDEIVIVRKNLEEEEKEAKEKWEKLLKTAKERTVVDWVKEGTSEKSSPSSDTKSTTEAEEKEEKVSVRKLLMKGFRSYYQQLEDEEDKEYRSYM